MAKIPNNVKPESLESFEVIDSCLKKHDKTRSWFNTLGSREKLIPRPIRQPRVSLAFQKGRIQLDDRGRPAFRRQGSVVFYPKGTGEYLEKIIRLHDDQGVPYKKIRERLKEERDALDRVLDVNLVQDKRVKDAGFFYNYRAAIRILTKLDVLDKAPRTSAQWKGLYEERVKCGREYYDAIEKMRRSHEKNDIETYEAEKKRRDSIGERLDFIHDVMEAVIKSTFKLVETKYPKDGGMKHWFEAVKEVEKED
jgi:hypothetical protein